MPDISAIGMMSEAFFRPRSILIEWLKKDFDCQMDRVEQCGNGAMYLQIMDRMFPGTVPMAKIRWDANNVYDMVKNYKLLQDVFKACNLQKQFNIESLSKCRCQDNLEFLQWMRAVYEKRWPEISHISYNPWERRQLSQWNTFPEWAKPGRQSILGPEEIPQSSSHLPPQFANHLHPLPQLAKEIAAPPRKSNLIAGHRRPLASQASSALRTSPTIAAPRPFLNAGESGLGHPSPGSDLVVPQPRVARDGPEERDAISQDDQRRWNDDRQVLEETNQHLREESRVARKESRVAREESRAARDENILQRENRLLREEEALRGEQQKAKALRRQVEAAEKKLADTEAELSGQKEKLDFALNKLSTIANYCQQSGKFLDREVIESILRNKQYYADEIEIEIVANEEENGGDDGQNQNI